MRLVRVALASANSTVGAVESNVTRMVELAQAAVRDDGATIVVFAEQAIGGYAPEDLVQWDAFVSAQWRGLERFAVATAELDALLAIGLVVAADGARVLNTAALVAHGRIHAVVPKEKLPFYNVFYEERCLARGVPGVSSTVHGVPFGDLVVDTPSSEQSRSRCARISGRPTAR